VAVSAFGPDSRQDNASKNGQGCPPKGHGYLFPGGGQCQNGRFFLFPDVYDKPEIRDQKSVQGIILITEKSSLYSIV